MEDKDVVDDDNPDWVTLDAASLFAQAVGTTVGVFFLSLPESERTAVRFLDMLRGVLASTEEDPELGSERDRKDLRLMRRCFEETMKSPSMKLLPPLDGPPH